MGRIIKSELFKLIKNKTFIILCCICIVFGGLTAFMSSDIMKDAMTTAMGEMTPEQQAMMENMAPKEDQLVTPGSMGIQMAAEDMMNPTIKEIFHTSFGSGVIEILIGVLIAGILVKEYTQGTIKNTLAYGVSRKKFYFAKFISSVISITIFMFIITGIATLGSMIFVGEGIGTTEFIEMLTTFGSAVLAASSVSAIMMLIGIFTKSTAAVIGSAVGIFMLLPNLIGMLYGKMEWFDKIFELTPYYNLSAATSVYADNSDKLLTVGISMVTIIIFMAIGSVVFEKQDIK